MLLLKNVRLSYPSLFTPSAFGDGEAKFNASFIMEKGSEQHKQLKAEIARVAKDEFGDGYEQLLKKQNSGQRALIKDGDEKTNKDGDQMEGYEGMVYFKASNKLPITVVGRARETLTESSGKPYSGCYVNVQIDVWAQNNKYGKFINIKLLGVQFWEDGEAFSGASTRANIDAFDVAEDEESLVDEMTGTDDW